MRFLRRFVARFVNFAIRRKTDQRLREEMEDHLALQTAENLRAGMTLAVSGIELSNSRLLRPRQTLSLKAT